MQLGLLFLAFITVYRGCTEIVRVRTDYSPIGAELTAAMLVWLSKFPLVRVDVVKRNIRVYSFTFISLYEDRI